MPSALQNAILRGRRRTLAQLAKDYRGTAMRLGQAYNGALPVINSMIVKLVESGDFHNEVTSSYALGELVQGIAGELQPLQEMIHVEGRAISELAASRGYQAALFDMNAGGMAIGWNQVSHDAIVGVIDIVNRPAWRTRYGVFSRWHSEKIGDLIITAVAQGRNPRETAALIRHWLENGQTPLFDALNITRTAQIYGQRMGANATYERHGVEYWIWLADLGGSRTCMGCIAMHGTRHRVDDGPLNDHHRGRCTPAPETPRWEQLGLTGGRDVPIETGVDWFHRQPAERQRSIMGAALHDEWRRGRFDFQPDQVTRTYENDIFGTMRRVRTNQEILSQAGFSN